MKNLINEQLEFTSVKLIIINLIAANYNNNNNNNNNNNRIIGFTLINISKQEKVLRSLRPTSSCVLKNILLFLLYRYTWAVLLHIFPFSTAQKWPSRRSREDRRSRQESVEPVIRLHPGSARRFRKSRRSSPKQERE